MIPNDPASDPEVVRVARIFAAGPADDPARFDPDEIMADGEPRWRQHVDQAVGAIHAARVLFG